MRWLGKDFKELTARELYSIIALRQRVFVVEQTCVYLDADGLDPECHHLWAETGGDALAEHSGAMETDRVIVAYLRIVPAGLRFAEVSIGRVVTAPEARGTGLGRELMQRGLALVREREGLVPVCLSAQTHLERFYGALGFVRTSANYDEDGIPHLKMRRAGS